ncbi:GerAB/ArcD/ProY family transporter [Paenibacillus arenilitoris]|uniref:Endospore germination permease n=1 Tax=Paenibacillus arenilitoris TaxID=2772299 RepID=A0A927CNT1_9BACL|nr:endospore germination permease [Paenibacillus arenilitoris]MBD2870292.1 endospore germination permease [Paenibacillus arenilitoris]
MTKISLYQLFCGILFFQQGTTIIFGFSSGAGRDAWICTLLSTAFGACLVYLFTVLMRLQDGLMLTEWFPALFGRYVGVPIAWLYFVLFFYDASRIIADLKFTINMIMLPDTPEWAVLAMFMLVAVYMLFNGIEVLFRIAGILVPIVTALYALQIILLLSSGTMHADFLLPVAGEGWARIWRNVWPLSVMQSFGETLLFAMFWPLVVNRRKAAKVSVSVVFCSGLFLTVLNLLIITTLGEGVYKRSIYPTISMLRLISVGDFIENLDALGLMFFIVTTFFKLSFYMFGCVFAFRQLAFVKNDRRIIVPLAAVSYCVGITMSNDIVEHIQSGFEELQYYVWIPLMIGIPVLLLPFAWKKSKKLKEGT